MYSILVVYAMNVTSCCWTHQSYSCKCEKMGSINMRFYVSEWALVMVVL